MIGKDKKKVTFETEQLPKVNAQKIPLISMTRNLTVGDHIDLTERSERYQLAPKLDRDLIVDHKQKL